MTAYETFGWGFLGSAAVEVVTLVALYSSPRRSLPPRYRKAGFWVTRTVLAALAGLLAVAYEIDKRILAFNVGAATPLLITFMARGVRLMTADSGLPSRAAESERPEEEAHDRTVAESRRGRGGGRV
ncbi:MAG TPA: hypothetical protein VFV19_01435 [Candidatus Polarisedimenticolaceae bacterium]|nr:hypothetical protein [Candidatus Polarisedimenticolaceae bacterium]